MACGLGNRGRDGVNDDERLSSDFGEVEHAGQHAGESREAPADSRLAELAKLTRKLTPAERRELAKLLGADEGQAPS